MRLNLGSNDMRFEDFLNLDHRKIDKVDIVDDAFALDSFEQNSVKEMIASHILEHASFDRTVGILKRWKEVLTSGGILWVAVPNYELVYTKHLENYNSGEIDWEFFNSRIFGNANINHNNAVSQKSWIKTAHMSRKCYLSETAPGSINKNPSSGLKENIENIKYSMEESEKGYKNFAVIETKINSIEWLFLAAKGHRRAKFMFENETIKKNWLTP